MSVLVIAEHHSGQLSPATLSTLTAAQKLESEVHILVAGHGCATIAAEAAKIAGAAKVLCCDSPLYAHGLAETMGTLVASIGKAYSHILAPATSFGKDIAPRAAALLDAPQVSDVIEVVSKDTFKHPIYAGNAIETVQSTSPLLVLTVRQTAFGKAATTGNAPVENIAPAADTNLSSFVEKQETKLDRPELTSARVVVSGGRGLGSAENFKLIETLADKLGAAIGASRAAVDAGYVPNDYQVGQTGKVVAPELYIAVGISGAIQHLAGMKDSKVIVAINKDENAPIFEIADYGLIGDLFAILPELEKSL